jgi:hypothetical protein
MKLGSVRSRKKWDATERRGDPKPGSDQQHQDRRGFEREHGSQGYAPSRPRSSCGYLVNSLLTPGSGMNTLPPGSVTWDWTDRTAANASSHTSLSQKRCPRGHWIRAVAGQTART